MEVILHLGAHRTASTSFQHYMRFAGGPLGRQGVGFWGPLRTRGGLLNGLADAPQSPTRARRIQGRVRLNLHASQKRGVRALVVSDENLIGTQRRNLLLARLYPDIGVRMARVHTGFGHVTRIVLQIRSTEMWWASALAFLLRRGLPLPDPDHLAEIAAARRGWRDVITDLACACPGTEIVVVPFESMAGRGASLLGQMVPCDAPAPPGTGIWVNRSPDLAELRALVADRGEDPERLGQGDGRWIPFAPRDAARLREAYADDLFWLRAGADGLARLTEQENPDDTRQSGASEPQRGQDHGRERHPSDPGRLAPAR